MGSPGPGSCFRWRPIGAGRSTIHRPPSPSGVCPPTWKACYLWHIGNLDKFYHRFAKELPVIDQYARELKTEYQRRFDAAARARQRAYEGAVRKLETTPGWERLTDDQKAVVREPLAAYAAAGEEGNVGIP